MRIATLSDCKAFVKTVLPSLGAEDRMSPALVPPLAAPALRSQLWLIRGIRGGTGLWPREKSEPRAGRGGVGVGPKWRRMELEYLLTAVKGSSFSNSERDRHGKAGEEEELLY